MIPKRVSDRALANVKVDEAGCWISAYAQQARGYVVMSYVQDGKQQMCLAHRAAWSGANKAEIPEGMTVDHMCKVRNCMNPDHLRLLSNFDNARRNTGHDWPLGQCRHGHPDSERVPKLEYDKRGNPRMSTTCGPCRAASNRGHRVGR